MIIILWIIAIAMVLTLFVIASVGRLFDETKDVTEDINPGFTVSQDLAKDAVGTEQQVKLMLEAAEFKAGEGFYSLPNGDRTAQFAHRLSKVETSMFKVKMQIFTFSVCLGAFSLFMGIWAAIETVK